MLSKKVFGCEKENKRKAIDTIIDDFATQNAWK
jgi:hypothetical protein